MQGPSQLSALIALSFTGSMTAARHTLVILHAMLQQVQYYTYCAGPNFSSPKF